MDEQMDMDNLEYQQLYKSGGCIVDPMGFHFKQVTL